MRILVIGKTGQLARALNTVDTVAGAAAQIGFLGRERLDLMIPGMAAMPFKLSHGRRRVETRQ